ncbi:hypothetical protein BKA63DRAFT_593681 [Paraphoma chrysanthemicola]|nr:hypothetical protein BKA63DRAFT_593681 [Paraphoma chrysanthemicola]
MLQTHKSDVPGTVNSGRCRLLELPAKIRNRIYDFVQERGVYWCALVDDDCHPLLSFRKDPFPTAPVPATFSARNFIALMQTCRQVRADYRPLWLVRAQARIRMYDLPRYMQSYFPTQASLRYVPKLLQIAWYHGKDDKHGTEFDILPLLQMRASRQDFRFEFVSHKLAQELYPQSMYDNDFPHIKDWMIDCTFEIDYMEGLQDLINHDDANWLNDIQNGFVTALEIRYQCNKPGQEHMASSTTMVSREYLDTHGLFSLQGESLKFQAEPK